MKIVKKSQEQKQELIDLFGSLNVQTQKVQECKEQEGSSHVLIISGPTASGKTSLSLKIAQKLCGEIISADSMQVYRGMDIGTAKATEEECRNIPHHMIDIRDINAPLTVVDFYYEAKKAIQSALARGRVPIVVGGSGFYIHSLIYGPPEGPPSDLDLRKSLEQEANELGTAALYNRLVKLDPQYATSITSNDKQKIVRGLEIIALTGSPVSDFAWKRGHPLDYNFHCWFLNRPREILYERVEKRCEEMLERGLIDEVQSLLEKGLLENRSAAQAIGYRQVLDFLDSDRSECAYHELEVKFKQATRHYVKRQLTWFGKEPLFQWLDMEERDEQEAAELIADEYLIR